MKKIFILLLLFSSQSYADGLDQAGKACLHKDSKIDICHNAQAFIKKVEAVSLGYLREKGLESSVAVVAFTVDTISKGHVSIPQVLPWYKNSINISDKSVQFQMTIPVNF